MEKEKVSYGVNVPEDPEENIQDGDDESVMIVEFLSTVSPPHIIELLPRSALLSWSALSESEKNVELDIAESDLGYEVLLADIAKGGKYKSIYNGCSLSCRYVSKQLNDIIPKKMNNTTNRVYYHKNPSCYRLAPLCALDSVSRAS